MASGSDNGTGVTHATARADARLTIAVWGHYHGRNIGDELVVSLLVDAIHARIPDARVVGVSMRPEDTRERHGIDAYPIDPLGKGGGAPSQTGTAQALEGKSRLRRLAAAVPGARRLYATVRSVRRAAREAPFSIDTYKFLRDVDLVVVAGSGQLLDEWVGPWGHPYTTFRWATLARLARVPVVYPSVGAGPIDAQLSKLMLRRALATAQSVTVRDESSRALLAGIGVRRELRVIPDMAHAWRLPPAHGGADGSGTRPRAVIGVNVMAHQDPRYWPRGSEQRYRAYIAKMAAVVRMLLAGGTDVHLFSSQSGADGPATDDLVQELGTLPPDGGRVASSVGDTQSADDLVELLAGFDAVVAGRYHSLLLPMAMGIPVVGLAYNPKTPALLGPGGLGDCCFDMDDFTPEEIVSKLGAVRADWAAARRGPLAAHVETCREAVEVQFDELFLPLRRRPALARSPRERGRAAA